MKTDDIQIFLGLDVGKTDHWGCAVTVEGTTPQKRCMDHGYGLTRAGEALPLLG